MKRSAFVGAAAVVHMSCGVQVFPSSRAYSIEICKQRLDLIVGHVEHEGLHVGSCENSLKFVKPYWLVLRVRVWA